MMFVSISKQLIDINRKNFRQIRYIAIHNYSVFLRIINTHFTEICCHTAYTSHTKKFVIVTHLFIKPFHKANINFLNKIVNRMICDIVVTI